MTQNAIARPPVASRAEWLEARKKLLTDEKELTKHYDRVNAERRRLPMVKIEKDYAFEGPEGKKSLKDLFGDNKQLIVYHFMFDPTWDTGCEGCTGFVDSLGPGIPEMLHEKSIAFVLISRAPLAKLQAYATKRGWDWPWYSSFGSEFNYDFHATLDEKVAPIEYNYIGKEQLEARRGKGKVEGEDHGISVFLRDGDDLFHTYSAYARGTENITNAYELMDITPYGRQQDFEVSPDGWPQKPTYG